MDSEKIRQILQQRTVALPDGIRLPAIGQGTWNIGDVPAKREQEISALQLGVELGMTLIDTAEMYGEGKSERLTGEAIQGKREQVFLVSKVYPHNAGTKDIYRACENSLERLGTDTLDLYLLHWRGRIPLEETVEGMEQLKKDGKIKRWGVSNFDVDDMEELLQIPGGENCAVNQVLYHLGSRGIEYELLPWHMEHGIPIMAYSPLAQGGSPHKNLQTNQALKKIAEKHHVEPLQIALAWTIRSGHVISIPKAGQPQHVTANAEAAAIELMDEDLKMLDEAFPPPNHKPPLDVI
ncbi:aldo/keto reductase [Planococcus salinus]|uniref:Aldo/keto reductase n=2 Tax=Planococcus salinus TaxID=1848460 RepID=A0A3M8P5Y1_9BACL|nr:aldo/keto reductase [Planococcus salinus]